MRRDKINGQDQRFELDDLLLLRELTTTPLLNRWSASNLLKVSKEAAAERLASLRGKGYLVVRGRGRTASYQLRRNLAERLRDREVLAAELPLEEEAVRLRVLALLHDKGRLTNAEVQRISGFNRVQVYKIFKELVKEGKARYAGKGRGSHIVPIQIVTVNTKILWESLRDVKSREESMIKVWLAKTVRHEDEKDVTSFPPLEISPKKAIEKFHLAEEHWISPLDSPPRFQEESDLPATFHEYRYVILEISEGVPGWKAGFYLIPESVLSPDKAFELMAQENWQPDQARTKD